MKKSRGARLAAAGFTLIELVMTLVVVGILAVFAVGRLNFAATFDEKALHDRLLAGLQFARKTAVANRRTVCVTVVEGANGTASFRVRNAVPEAAAGDCTGAAGTDLNLPSPDRTAGCAANQVCGGSLSTASTNTSFQFDALGRLTAAASVTFTTTGPHTVTVEAETGYVH